MIGQPKRNTALRRRKPRDICASIITDRLELIEKRLKLGPLTDVETEFVLAAHKAFTDADQTDAEVSYLESLTPEQSNRLEEMLAELEEETKASDN